MVPGASLAYSAVVRSAGATGGGGRSGAASGAAVGGGRDISGLLPLAVAVAVCEAVEKLAPVTAQIKWPNDVWIEGRKCGGILVEAQPQSGWGVVGVGLNLSVDPSELPAELRERTASVGGDARPATATAALNRALGRWLGEASADAGASRPGAGAGAGADSTGAGDEAVIAAFGERDALRGRAVAWDGGRGTALGVDAAGALLVREAGYGATRALNSGEVHLAPLDDGGG